MPKKPRKARIDPELRKQLGVAAAAKDTSAIQAVLRLRPGRGALAPAPEKTLSLAEDIVARAAKQLGKAAGKYDYNVFPNLGYFVLSGKREFVEQVVGQPEIASASANRRSS